MQANRLLPTAGLIIAALVAGCGGDDDGDGGGEKPTRAAYVRQVNKICDDTEDKLQDLQQPTNAEEAQDVIQRGGDALKEGLEKAQDIELPEEDADEFESYLEDRKAYDEELVEDTLEVVEDHKDDPLEDLADAVDEADDELDDRKDELDDKAERLGLDDCASF